MLIAQSLETTGYSARAKRPATANSTQHFAAVVVCQVEIGALRLTYKTTQEYGEGI
ncbi:MAG: hypothetical protein V7K71_12360 [Nostoc sp.]|uniref:hypothetical protein n=1 Tax=Nostoc sp. TaxID=1180 RepID=UPI002FF7FE59